MAAIWLLCVAVAAAINVPLAVILIRSRSTPRPRMSIPRADIPKRWPAATPHSRPWTEPTSWDEGGAFGYRGWNVISASTQPGQNGFQMQLEQMGWPFPVIEIKQMWWDWDDPALKGPENDPRPTLVIAGLILNPLLLGTGAFVVLDLPLFVTFARRRRRRARGECMHCGYPIRTPSPICPECGNAVAIRESSSARS